MEVENLYSFGASLNTFKGHWHKLFALAGRTVTISKANPSHRRSLWEDREEIKKAAIANGYTLLIDNIKIATFVNRAKPVL